MTESDRTQLGSIIGYLRHTHKIPAHLIKKEHHIVFCGTQYGIFSRVTYDLLRGMNVNQPDIIILDPTGTRVRLILEYDGPGHYKYPRRIRQTKSRNARYRDAKIPFSVINIEELNARKISVFDYVDIQMAGHT